MDPIDVGDRVKIVWAKDVPSHDAVVERLPREGDELWYLRQVFEEDPKGMEGYLMAINPRCSNFAMFIKLPGGV